MESVTPRLTVLEVRAQRIDLTYLIDPVMQGPPYITPTPNAAALGT
jgi:hypothetical protein